MPPEIIGTAGTDPISTGGVDLLIALRSAQETVGIVFRAMVDSVSNPGRIHRLPMEGLGVEAVVLPVLVIADLRTSLTVVGPDTADDVLAHAISRVTGAPLVNDVPEARIVVISDPGLFTADLVWQLQVGTAHAPETGATAVIACGRVDEAEPESPGSFRTSGPGAADGRWFTADGIDHAAMRDLDRVNSGYPAGVDVYLVDGVGNLVALPRSNRLSIGGDV